jgi:hypothetical protein
MTSLPKSSRDLREVFRNARTPEVTEFHGEYLVRMLTAMPSLHGLKHRKSFRNDQKGTVGKNIVSRNFVWGNFFLEEGTMPGPEKLKVVVINYDAPGNTILTRRIRDLVRAVEGDRLYLGRFNMLINGKLRFLGYFSLTKIEP